MARGSRGEPGYPGGFGTAGGDATSKSPQPGRNFKPLVRNYATPESDQPIYQNPHESDAGTIDYQDSKSHEYPYVSWFEQVQANENVVEDLDNLKGAEGYNRYHDEHGDGQANPGEAGIYGGKR